MLRALQRRLLLFGTAAVLTAAARYVAIMLVFIVLLGQLAKLAL